MARILCVEDEAELLDTVRRILARDKHEVVACGSGGEALVELEGDPFDLVITDLMMPDVDGMAVLVALFYCGHVFQGGRDHVLEQARSEGKGSHPGVGVVKLF